MPRPDAVAALLDANYDGEAAMLTVVKMLTAGQSPSADLSRHDLFRRVPASRTA